MHDLKPTRSNMVHMLVKHSRGETKFGRTSREYCLAETKCGQLLTISHFAAAFQHALWLVEYYWTVMYCQIDWSLEQCILDCNLYCNLHLSVRIGIIQPYVFPSTEHKILNESEYKAVLLLGEHSTPKSYVNVIHSAHIGPMLDFQLSTNTC